MTKTEKCDVCRARKIKCDERKPFCSCCVKSGRICTYNFQDSFRLIHGPRIKVDGLAKKHSSSALDREKDDNLRLRSSRQAPSGPGSYHTLSLKKAACKATHAERSSLQHTNAVPASPSSEIAQLASRWSYMIGPLQQKVPMPYGNADIFRRVPSRLGTDAVLDAAVRYNLDSHHAFVTRNEKLAAQARRSGIEAMRCLRSRISSAVEDPNSAVALSMVLLVTAEYYHDLEGYLFQVHALALTRLLKSRWIGGQWGGLEQTLLQSIWLEEVEESVFSGTDSEFDDPARLLAKEKAGLKTQNELLVAFDYVIEKMVLIPRLLRYARQYASRPHDSKLAMEIEDLVTYIYDSAGQERIEGLISSEVRIVASSNSALADPSGLTFVFPAVPVFTLTAFYYMYRLIICGIIQRLFDLGLPRTIFWYERDIVEAEDVRAAEKVAMCVEYGLADSASGPSYKAIRLHTPLVMAWGAWNRLEQRAASLPTFDGSLGVEAEWAACMKVFCKTSLTHIMQIWHAPKLLDVVEATSDAFTGGPTIPMMSRRAQTMAWPRTLSDGTESVKSMIFNET